jgi:hypothetical protein
VSWGGRAGGRAPTYTSPSGIMEISPTARDTGRRSERAGAGEGAGGRRTLEFVGVFTCAREVAVGGAGGAGGAGGGGRREGGRALMADTIGWSAATSTNRRCCTW